MQVTLVDSDVEFLTVVLRGFLRSIFEEGDVTFDQLPDDIKGDALRLSRILKSILESDYKILH